MAIPEQGAYWKFYGPLSDPQRSAMLVLDGADTVGVIPVGLRYGVENYVVMDSRDGQVEKGFYDFAAATLLAETAARYDSAA